MRCALCYYWRKPCLSCIAKGVSLAVIKYPSEPVSLQSTLNIKFKETKEGHQHYTNPDE